MAAALSVLDLFSGIGGMSLGLEWTGGFQTVRFCETDGFCRQVLRKHWPEVPIHDDVRTLSADAVGPVDIITAGFPCQDISYASPTRQGIDGDRSGLWSEVARLISELRPSYALLENSAALLHRGLGRVLGDLATIRYDTMWDCLRASSLGAPFEGDRIYLLASPYAIDGTSRLGVCAAYLNARTIQRSRHQYSASVWLETTSRLARMGHGFSDFVDRRRRTEVLGNAVVPQVITTIGQAILVSHAAAE